MIYGLGSDLLDVRRISQLIKSYNVRFMRKVLSEKELSMLDTVNNINNFIAKRFAAKEAFSKACKTGIKSPVLFTNISVLNDSYGSPYFVFADILGNWIRKKLFFCDTS